MNNSHPQLRYNAVQYYLKNGGSYRKTALRFHIAYRTLFKWVKLYRQEGEKRLLSTYKKPWNRTPKELEEKIVLLKEKDPCITVRKAKEILGEHGINISIKGIWEIWKRYGYSGFIKEKIGDHYSMHCPWSIEATKKLEQAKQICNLGNIKESAQILNSIPVLPRNELILQIPDSYLNLRRQAEKTPLSFGKIPVRSYLKKIRNLYEECKRKKLYYSALRTGISEVIALSWTADTKKQLNIIKESKKILKRPGNHFSYSTFGLRFSLLISEGIIYSHLLKIKKASEIARTCKKMLIKRKNTSPYCMFNLGILYTNLDDFREAEYWYLKALEKESKKAKKTIERYLANILFLKGKYKNALHTLKNAELPVWGYRSRKLLFRTMQSLINGMPHKAISLSIKNLSMLKKEEIRGHLFRTYFTIAISYCSLGQKPKAKSTLKKILPFLTKNKLEKETTIIRTLLSHTPNRRLYTLLGANILPTVKLALMLKNGSYLRAFKYADKRGMMADFHRYVFFFPDAVIKIIKKGKPTRLPKTMVRLPVFNKEIPVYHIKFLGKLIVNKNQKYLGIHPLRKKIRIVSRTKQRSSNGVKLQPKDIAFLIHLALRVGEPKKEIPLENIYNNFWKNSKNPARNLSHLLVRIKKALKIPSHLLDVSYKKDNPILINRGLHFIADYDEYQESIVQARALERAEEWGFAKNEYIRAFKLFRGEPFEKMYDNWSEHMRRVIFNQLENETINFAESCLKHNNKADAKKVLERVTKIIPQSEEIRNIVKSIV